MRCHICNAVLGPTEVQWNNQHEEWDPCGRCLQAIEEVFNDQTEEEIDAEVTFMLMCEDEQEVADDEDEDVDYF